MPTTPPAEKPARAPTIGRLDSAVRVRRELTRLYREARAGRVPWSDACKGAHLLNSIARLLEACDLEQRVAALEARTDHSADLAKLSDAEIERRYQELVAGSAGRVGGRRH